MFKHQEILNRLSDSDKIAMICDISVLSDKKYKVLGIPEIKIGNIEETCENEYPSPAALANSWNMPLIGKVADDLMKKTSSRGTGFVRVPEPRIKINPYRQAISEDPLLATAVTKEFLSAAQRSELSVGIGGFGLHTDELEWLDISPDNRFIHEYIVKPYIDATKSTGCSAILTYGELKSPEYSNINHALMDMVLQNKISEGARAICRKVPAETTVSHLNKGGLFFEGSQSALESALSRYKKYQNDIKSGNATTEELESDIAKGKAISNEMLDSAADRLLDLIFTIKRKPALSVVAVEADTSVKATEDSVVLLKNVNKHLPARKNEKICIIGDIAMVDNGSGATIADECSKILSENGYTVVGKERGYDFSCDRNEDLIQPAVELIRNSTSALVFLGLGEDRINQTNKIKKISIPANQLELLDRLSPYKDRITVIIPSDISVDIGYPDDCASLLMAPFNTKYSGAAIGKVVAGKLNPSGKLSSSVYHYTEDQYISYKTRRVRDKVKSGPFIGYRYYDTSAEAPGFPFGHGLSFTRFDYLGMTVSNDKVNVTVKNGSKLAGEEIIQIYAAKPDSNVIRPQKELCGFAKVALKGGEKKTVSIDITLPKVYDEEKNDYVLEGGRYILYAAASVSDVRLSKRIEVAGVSIAPDNKSVSDYIHTKSNIITDNFKLEAKIKTMKKSVFNYIAGAVVLAMAVALKLYCVSSNLESTFLDWFIIIMGICGVALFVSEAIRRNNIKKHDTDLLNTQNEKLFEDAVKLSQYTADSMFAEEFDASEDAVIHEIEERVDGVEAEYLAYIDKDQNFKNAAEDFELYAKERGCKFRSEDVRKIFSAMAASRLVVVSGMNDKTFSKFMLLLSNYFETDLRLDKVDETYVNCESMLFQHNDQGNKSKTNAFLALEEAGNIPQNLHIAALTNVKGEDLPMYFTPIVNYVKSPKSNYHVTVLNEINVETSYYISPNLWFVLNLAEGESIKNLPSFVSELATVNLLSYEACTESEHVSDIRKFSYYQMDYLAEKAAGSFAVDEDIWKKIDRFEEYVNGYASFKIGNKMWLCLENFAHVNMACGGDMVYAVDEAVAAKLMPYVASLIDGKIPADSDDLDAVVENIFGEDKADACRKLIKACDVKKANKT